MGYHKERIRQFVGLPGTAMQGKEKANRHFVDCRGPLKCRTGKRGNSNKTSPHPKLKASPPTATPHHPPTSSASSPSPLGKSPLE